MEETGRRVEPVLVLCNDAAARLYGYESAQALAGRGAEPHVSLAARRKVSFGRIDPARAAVAFRGLIFAGAHPTVRVEEKLSVDEIVGVLLSGIVEPIAETVS